MAGTFDYTVGIAEMRRFPLGGEAERLLAELSTNLSLEAAYGTTENLRSERSQLVGRLNVISVQFFNTSFVELCQGVKL